MMNISGVFNDALTVPTKAGPLELRGTSSRALHVNLRTNAGVELGTVGTPLQVAGSLSISSATDASAWTTGVTGFTPGGGVFNDSAAVLTSGQQGTVRMTNNRAMHVNLRDHLGNEATLTGNSLNVNVTNAATGGTAAIDAAAWTAGASQFTPTGGVFNDSATALTSGQMGTVRLTSTRAMHVSVDNASLAVTGTFWQATQPVSGTFWQATQPISAASLPLPTGAALDSSVTAMSAKLPATLGQKTMANSMSVALASDQSSIPVTGTFWQATQPVSGTFWQATQPVSGTVTANQGGSNWSQNVAQINAVTPLMGNGVTGTGSLRVTIASDNTAFAVKATGDIADAATDSGNPVKIGAVVYTTSRTNLTTLQRANLNCDHQGTLVNYPVKPREFLRTQQTTITASTTETTIITAGGATVFNDIVSLTITNSSATALIVTLKDSTAGTTRAIYAIAANGGITINFPTPLAQQAAANNNWTLTCGTSVSSIYVSAVYVIAV